MYRSYKHLEFHYLRAVHEIKKRLTGDCSADIEPLNGYLSTVSVNQAHDVFVSAVSNKYFNDSDLLHRPEELLGTFSDTSAPKDTG